KTGEHPTLLERADDRDLRRGGLRTAPRPPPPPLSLTRPPGDEADSCYRALPEDEHAQPPPSARTQDMLRSRIDEVLDSLSLREREVVKFRFGIGRDSTYTLEELGKKFKVTRERIRQIEIRALKKLQHPTRARVLEGFID